MGVGVEGSVRQGNQGGSNNRGEAARVCGHAGARAPLLLASQRPRNFQARITFSVLLLSASAPRLGRNHCFCFM